MEYRLTKREKEVIDLLAVKCLTNKEAARELQISPRTIEDHRANIMEKLNAKNFAQVVRFIALGQ